MSAETNSGGQAIIGLTDQRLARLSVDVSAADVSLKDAPNADACGALGCRTTEELIRVEIPDFGVRVLCLQDLNELLEREVNE